MGWRIRRSAGVSAPPGAQVLVESGKTPLLFLVERRLGSDPSGEKFAALYANFNLPDTNLERSAGLAILLWNAIEALQGRRPEDVAIAHHTGVPISFQRRRVRRPSVRLQENLCWRIVTEIAWCSRSRRRPVSMN
jgi:hypothetical protein